MKNSLVIFLSILLASCQIEKVEENIDKNQLTAVTFEMGSKTHFTDSCTFYFECDCCSGNLLLNPDSTFLEVDNCMADRTLLFGKFEFVEDSLKLNYSGKVRKSEYNYENEFDTSAVDFFISETKSDPFSYSYAVRLCGEKIKLVSFEGKNLGLESSNITREIMKENLMKLGLYK